MRVTAQPFAIVACAAVALACGAESGVAEGLGAVGGTAELEARIAALEAQVAGQAGQRGCVAANTVSYLPDPDTAATCTDGSCGCVGRDFFSDCCRGCGFYGGAEIMFLKPFADGFGGVFIDAASADEYLPGWRLWGGYQNCDGLGWRVGWWQWDQTSTGQGAIFDADAITTLRLTFQKLDLEATQMLSFRRWDLLMGAGVTYVGSNYDTLLRDPVDADATGIFNRFDGWGLTTGLLALRDLPCMPGLKLFGSVQWSAVYGISVLNEAGGDQRLPIDSAMVNILELKVGPMYEWCIGRGTTFFVGGGFEAQYWTGLGGFTYFEGLGGDVGLVGFTVNTGFRR